MPETNDPKPDGERADGELTRAYERIKSAEQDLARLDKLVSGMEHDSASPRAPRIGASAARGDGAPSDKVPAAESSVRPQGVKRNRPMLRAVVGLLAIGILGAAFASQYHDETRTMMAPILARWAPPAASPPPAPNVAALPGPANPPAIQLAAADEPKVLPAPPVKKETESVPPAAATPPDQTSGEVAQSLKTITETLATINAKLEQQRSESEQTLRAQADAIQQLKTAQEKDAADNARLAAQVQALQTQLAASPAKPAVRSMAKENDTVVARQPVPAAAPRRPRPPRERWMPPRYMADPYGDLDW
ncbi:hypothetical protein [Bradyrhizobium jicamae]|uniref:hypothetical protein n=1 Tax=Bradyrhizobium jicamae TaxID=280332 RepID=UPI0032DF2393